MLLLYLEGGPRGLWKELKSVHKDKGTPKARCSILTIVRKKIGDWNSVSLVQLLIKWIVQGVSVNYLRVEGLAKYLGFTR